MRHRTTTGNTGTGTTGNTGTGTTTTGNTGTGTGGTTTGSTGTGSTGTTTTSPAPAPPTSTAPKTGPLTQVFVNGVSLGNYSTAQLAAKYPGLFAFLKGPVASIQIWAPAKIESGPRPQRRPRPRSPRQPSKHPAHVQVQAPPKKFTRSRSARRSRPVHKAAPKKSEFGLIVLLVPVPLQVLNDYVGPGPAIRGPGPIDYRAPRPSAVTTAKGPGLFDLVEVALSIESMTALVTGAGSGIGRATAVGLAKLGLRVALVGRDAGKLEATRKLMGAGNTLVEPCDVADRSGVASMARPRARSLRRHDRRPGLQRGDERPRSEPREALAGRLGQDDRYEPDRGLPPGPLVPAPDAREGQRPHHPGLLDRGPPRPACWAGRAIRPRSSARPRSGSGSAARKGPEEFARP